jgi:hypothetical protein
VIRPHMNLYGRRNSGLVELQDGHKLAYDLDDRIAPPMVRLSAKDHAYFHEAIQLEDQRWVYTQRWFSQHDQLWGTGSLLRKESTRFVLLRDHIDFPITSIRRSSISTAVRQTPVCEWSVPTWQPFR